MIIKLFLMLISMPPIPGRNLKSSYRKYVNRRGIKVNTPETSVIKGDSVKGIVLLVDFYDNESIKNVSEFENLLFSGDPGSMVDYYREIGYDKIEMGGDCSGWYTMPSFYSDYVGGNYGFNPTEPNVFTLVRDAVEEADPQVDFSKYDLDNDGMVDAIFIVHAGPGAEETGDTSDIWSHKSSFIRNGLSPVETDDGVEVNVYSMEPERFEDNSLITIGVFAHEFCHVLGSPDIYDVNTGGYVIGKFGLMDAGSWNGSPVGSSPAHPCAWIKYLLGWVDPIALEQENIDSIPQANIPQVEDNPTVYRLIENPGGNDWDDDGGGEGEYFLVENRQVTGYDSSLPGEGLLIYHCDESKGTNTDSEERMVSIMQADSDISTTTIGESDDPWKDVEEGFTETSYPSSIFWDGTPSGVAITNISSSGAVMNADLKINLVYLDRVYSYPNPFVRSEHGGKLTIRYVPSDIEDAQGKNPKFSVKIYNLRGQLARNLDREGEVFPMSRIARWDGRDESGEMVGSGMYFYIIETEEERNRGKFTYVR